jgi:hypothetical protein
MSHSLKLVLSLILITVIIFGLNSPVAAQPPYYPNVIVNPTSITAGVSTTYSVTVSVEDIAPGYGLHHVGIVLTWPSSDMELVSGEEGTSPPPGWNLFFGDFTEVPPGSGKKQISQSIILTGEPVTVEREWLTVTFHCLRPGPSTIIVDAGVDVQYLQDGSYTSSPRTIIEVTVNQLGTPVGGVTTPVNKTVVLAPYIALAGLIITISTVYVIKKRKD